MQQRVTCQAKFCDQVNRTKTKIRVRFRVPNVLCENDIDKYFILITYTQKMLFDY